MKINDDIVRVMFLLDINYHVGQTDAEVVLQSPARIVGMLFILFTLVLTQLFFVYKKKQLERSCNRERRLILL